MNVTDWQRQPSKKFWTVARMKADPSFTTLWDADEVWGKEAIWQAVLNEGDQWGGWDGAKWSEAHGWVGFIFARAINISGCVGRHKEFC